jgi:hypothetical protein
MKKSISVVGGRTSGNVPFRAAVKDIADIKRDLIRATSHFMSTRPRPRRYSQTIPIVA